MQNRLLVFDNCRHLSYWFKYIVKNLKGSELLFKVKMNDYIDYGTQRWTFKVKNNHNFSIGWRDPIFYNVEYELERDFINTIKKIIKGENNGYKRN